MNDTDLIPRLIIDTDFETDCDDAGALAVAHKLADEKLIDLAAVNASVNSPLPALGTAALNAAFGRRADSFLQNGQRYTEQNMKAIVFRLLLQILCLSYLLSTMLRCGQ